MSTQVNSRALLVARYPVGGIRTYIAGMLLSAPFRDLTIDLLLPDVPEASVLKETLSGAGVEVRLLPDSALALSRGVATALLSRQYSLVHSHGFTACLASCLVASMRRVPHLTTAHDVFTEQQFIGVRGAMRRQAIDAALSMCTAIHCVTQDAANNLLQHIRSVKAEKIQVIPHGVDTAAIRNAARRDFRAELALPREMFLVGFLGRFMAQKGFRYLVRAVLALKQRGVSSTRLGVICLGGGGFIREDRAFADELGVADYFRFLPMAPQAGGAIKGMDVVVMPSLWEASGLLAMETLAAGVPLVASTCEGLRETISESPALRIPPRDAQALADAIETLMTAPRRDEFARFVPEAESRFDGGRAYGSVRALYRRMDRGRR